MFFYNCYSFNIDPNAFVHDFFKVPNSAILDCTNFSDFSGKELMDPKIDKTTKVQLVDSNFH